MFGLDAHIEFSHTNFLFFHALISMTRKTPMKKRRFLPFLILAGLFLCLPGCTFLYESRATHPEDLQPLRLQAEQAEAEGRYKVAAKAYGKLARVSISKAVAAKFYARRAKCQLLAGKINPAKASYEELLKNYPLYISYEQTVEELRQLAECFESGKGTFLGLRDPYNAVDIYQTIVRETPAVHVSLKDRMKLAELLLKIGRQEEAANVYKGILKQDPEQHETRLKLAVLLEEFSHKGDGDGRKLRAATREINAFLQKTDAAHPNRADAEALLLKMQNTEATRMLNLAKFYMLPRHKRDETAKKYLVDLIREFPNTEAAKEARQILEEKFETKP